MKKVQLLTLVAALALGGGSVFAATANHNKAEEVPTATQNIEIQLDTQDQDILKAFETGDVTILVEDEASEDFSIQADSEELQKAMEAGVQIETTDAALAKAIEAGEVVVNIEE